MQKNDRSATPSSDTKPERAPVPTGSNCAHIGCP